jgi:DNA-binding NarL/FixJ family response regulator
VIVLDERRERRAEVRFMLRASEDLDVIAETAEVDQALNLARVMHPDAVLVAEDLERSAEEVAEGLTEQDTPAPVVPIGDDLSGLVERVRRVLRRRD